MSETKSIVLIKGAGEVASGIAYMVHKAGYRVLMTEIPAPLAVSRATCFSEAVFDGSKTVEGITGDLTPVSAASVAAAWGKGHIPVLIDPETKILKRVRPDVLVDARMLKQAADTGTADAPLVIGIGTCFTAGTDVHVIVESNDTTGNLGKLIYRGESDRNTREPIAIGGLTKQRVVWAQAGGIFSTNMKIGDAVAAGQTAGSIDGTPVKAPISGFLRGLIHSGVAVTAGAKLLEVDQVNPPESYLKIREKMVILGKAVVEAIRKGNRG
jgi:xanthine dehydrogenase accessory factor